MSGPCLCGDPYCGRCFGGGDYDPPDACPHCGAPNADENGEVLDATYDTCGRASCAAAEKSRREEWAKQEAEADRAERAYLRRSEAKP